jgi:glycyl-tRNA synthetase
METLYEKNGLIFWTEDEIKLRHIFEQHFTNAVLNSLRSQNSAFQMVQVEAPLLTPNELINPNYSADDVYTLGDLTLRPETTMGSYAFARHILSSYYSTKFRPPIIVWQHGKSFRREQDQPSKFMRLKEFYQLEFQIIYGATTKNDYALITIPDVQKAISEMIGPCRQEKSDRLPDYSEETMDIICESTNMEVCSISKRKDFEPYKVLEVAIGTDRCIYNFKNK